MPVKLAKKMKKLKIAKPGKIPVAQKISSGPRQPVLATAKGATTLTHREIVLESLLNSSSYAVRQAVALQPALSVESNGVPMGKWLPNIAVEYDNYEFTSLKVHYVPTCSTISTGLVVMSYDPNPNGAAPATFSDARNAVGCVTAAVRDRLTLDLTPHVVRRKLLTRTRRVNELAMYDVGRLFLCTTAGDNASSVGYVEVEYSIKLTNPQTASSGETTTIAASVFPSQEWIGTSYADGTVFRFGTTIAGSADGYRNGTDFQDLCMGTASTGNSLITINPLVARTANLSTTPVSGFKHTIGGGGVSVYARTFSCKLPGLYRIKLYVPGDWQNFAMFGAELLDWGVTTNIATGSPSFLGAGSPLGYSSSGSLILGSAYGGYVRGFATTLTGGTDNDDLAMEIDTNFVSVGPAQRFSLSCGMRDNTEVAENAEGRYKPYQNGGRIRCTFTYLGTVDGLS